jgi:hypothetical protein
MQNNDEDLPQPSFSVSKDGRITGTVQLKESKYLAVTRMDKNGNETISRYILCETSKQLLQNVVVEIEGEQCRVYARLAIYAYSNAYSD